MLLPAFNKAYWIGLRSNSTAWPAFTWEDPYVPAPVVGDPASYA
jgi:hypothetical protein